MKTLWGFLVKHQALLWKMFLNTPKCLDERNIMATFGREPYALNLSNQLCLLSEKKFDRKDIFARINQVYFHHTVIFS